MGEGGGKKLPPVTVLLSLTHRFQAAKSKLLSTNDVVADAVSLSFEMPDSSLGNN